MTAQREEWRRAHTPTHYNDPYNDPGPGDYCATDGIRWPCPTASLLAQLDEAEVRERELRAALELAELERDQQERFKWKANERADRMLALLDGMIEEAGVCVQTDPEDPICETHSELLFDGACEDQPRQLMAARAALTGGEG